ncbi:MAG: VTT domain-containing protein [Candidatus Pacebacteria bacterium]|nr:VTT domain-containing protein [Candidatus Paceibacterota bacterium]
MNKFSKFKIIFLIIGLLILASLLILNFNYFKQSISDFIENRLVSWGYLGFFLFIFLLEALPQPFLSALIPLVTGVILGFNAIYLIWLTVIGSVLANYAAYYLGLSLENSAVSLFIKEENYNKSLRWFNKYGKKSFSLLALSPLPYFPMLGGVFKMSFYEFTKYAIIPRIIHYLIFSSILILSL